MKAARLLFRPAGGAFPGVDTALAEAEGVGREQLLNLEWLSDGSYAMLYRLSGDREAVATVLADHPEVLEFDLVGMTDATEQVDAAGDDVYAFVHAEERATLSDLLAIGEDHALLLEPPFSMTDGGIAVTVAGEAAALRAAYAEASETMPVDVAWSGDYEPGPGTALSQLTARQREALEAAHELGFYERPRETDYEELGTALNCAPSTANELLRRAEATLVAAVLER